MMMMMMCHDGELIDSQLAVGVAHIAVVGRNAVDV